MPAPPMDLGSILEWSFTTLWRNARVFLGITALLLGPYLALLAVSGGLEGSGAVFPVGQAPAEDSAEVNGFIALLGLVNFIVLSPAMYAALYRAAAGRYLGEEVGFADALRYGFRRFGSILLIDVLLLLIAIGIVLPVVVIVAAAVNGDYRDGGAVVVAFLAAFIVFAWVFVRLAFSQVVVVTEGRRGRAAIRRSWELSRKRFWRILGMLLLGIFLAGVLGFAVNTVTIKLAEGGGVGGDLLVAGGQLLTQTVLTPFFLLVITALSYAIRAGKEAFDVRLALDDVRAGDR